MPWHQYYDSATTKLKAIKLPREAAGHNITARVPIAISGETIGQVKTRLFEEAEHFDTVNYIYVLSASHRLLGVFSIKEIFKQAEDTPVNDIFIKPPTVSHPQVDQERVAHLAIKHNIKSIPIVDDHQHFLGIVPSDKILSILNHEHQEDIYRMAGISAHGHQNLTDASIWESSAQRTPWILIGILGGLATAKIVGLFEHVLSANILLAGFIPLVAYVANAVGVQAQTLMIREMAINHGQTKWLWYSLRQLMISLIISLASFSMLLTLAIFLWQSVQIGLVIGASVVAAILVSTLMALLIPWCLNRLGQDPAVGSGPFATIIQDMLSILIYFLVASLMI